MTKKHFLKLAASVRTLLETTNNERMAKEYAELIADVCQDANVRFDRARFMRACGVK